MTDAPPDANDGRVTAYQEFLRILGRHEGARDAFNVAWLAGFAAGVTDANT